MNLNSAIAAASAMASPSAGEYGHLYVDRRVLRAGTKIVQISNICSVGLFETVDQSFKKAILIIFAIIISLISFLFILAGGIFGLMLAGFLIWSAMKIKQEFFMFIEVNSGAILKFKSSDRAFLEGAVDFLSRKINEADYGATQNFNFEKGAINSIDKADIHANAMNVEKMRADQVFSSGRDLNVVSSSPGAVVGVGSVSGPIVTGQGNAVGQGNAPDHSYKSSIIQFGALTGNVESLRQSMQTHGFDPVTISKLDEVLRLMKTGVPTQEEKSKLKIMSEEVCKILGAYPPAVQLLNNIVAMVA